MLYGHRLLSEVGPDAELWPQYTAGLIRLLEEGVEVIDLRDRFVDSGEPGAMQHWAHHWAPLGMEMAAELLGDRLRCEGWLDPEPEGRRFEEIHVLVQTPGSLRREHQAAFLSMPDNMVVKRIVDRSAQAPPTGIDPILLLGDSQLNTLASYPSGSGFPNYMSRELGLLVPFTGQGAGGPNTPTNYARWFGYVAPQPRVLVLVFSAYALTQDTWRYAQLPEQSLTSSDPGNLQRETVDVHGVFRSTHGTVGAASHLEVLARVVATSTAPDPAELLYDDALAVAQVEVEVPAGVGPIAVMDYVFRRRRATDFASVTPDDLL